MLNEIQKSKFTVRAEQEAKRLLKELKIEILDEDTLCEFQRTLDGAVSGLVSLKECKNQEIDEELLEIYDLLTDILLDYEENLDFLNQLFFS